MAKKSGRQKARARRATVDDKARRLEAREQRLAARRKKHRQGIVSPSSDPSFRRKLAWAEAHISDAEALISEWGRDGYKVFRQPNGSRGFSLFAQMVKPLPDDLPLVVGDALHGLWDCLDHVIFAISLKNPAMKIPDDEESPQFPVTRKGTAVDILHHVGIKFLNWHASAEVCDLAPDSTRKPLNDDPLWLLNKMNNRDKHREIAFKPLPQPGIGQMGIGNAAIDSLEVFGDKPMTLQGGPVLLLRFVGSHLQAHIRPTAPVLFDKGVEVEDREVIGTLRWFHDHIRDTVLPRLEPFL